MGKSVHRYRLFVRTRGRGLSAALASGLALLLSACSLDYGAALSEEFGEGMPDSVLYGFKHTVVENGSPRYKLEADTASSYDDSEKIVLSGVEFREYGADGTLVAEGSSAGVTFYPDTESADLSGGVEFFRAQDELLVQSGFLRWDGEAKLLTSRDDVVTRVRDGENSAIQGAGFSADAARRSFSFANQAQGSLSVDAAAEGGD
jgi:LPS export ABC transporter protein LptC